MQSDFNTSAAPAGAVEEGLERWGFEYDRQPNGVYLVASRSATTARAGKLARELFGSDDAFVSLNMAAYCDPQATAKIVGAPPGYVGHGQDQDTLAGRLKRQPQMLLLLDEVEKAHPAVWDMLQKSLDAGKMTDSSGQEVRLDGTVVVVTSSVVTDAMQARRQRSIDEAAATAVVLGRDLRVTRPLALRKPGVC